MHLALAIRGTDNPFRSNQYILVLVNDRQIIGTSDFRETRSISMWRINRVIEAYLMEALRNNNKRDITEIFENLFLEKDINGMSILKLHIWNFFQI